MNAPANIPQARVRLDETTTERAHRHVIAPHCSGDDEMQIAARCDIAAMRDAASIGMARATDDAAAMLAIVSRLAAQAVYADVPASRLIRIKSALTLSMMAAREIERLHRNG